MTKTFAIGTGQSRIGRQSSDDALQQQDLPHRRHRFQFESQLQVPS